jgi:PTS system nitrogen regulatory IIA component
MNIKKVLSKDAVLLDLKSDTKEGIIEEMINHLVSIGKIGADKRDEALEAVLVREKKMSTGMQCGIAIPHGKTDVVDGLVTALALKKEGMDFNSLDGEPSKIFVMTVSPASRTGPHIQFLAEISRLLNDPKIQEQILAAKSGEEILQLL